MALAREFSKHSRNLHREHAIKKHLLGKNIKSGLSSFEGLDLGQVGRRRGMYLLQFVVCVVVLALGAALISPNLRTTALEMAQGDFSFSHLNDPTTSGNNSSNSDVPLTNEDTGNSTQNNSNSNSNSTAGEDSSSASALRTAVFRHYNVTSFAEIKENGALAGMSQIHSISNVTPSKVTVRLNLTHSNTNRQTVRAIADKLLEISRGEDTPITTIIVITMDSYFLEQATSGGS